MKKKSGTGVAWICCIVMVVFSVCYGAHQGWAGEYRDVTATLNRDDGLLVMLNYRGYDGLNLYKVAQRHLPETNENLSGLIESARALIAKDSKMRVRYESNKKLTEFTKALVAELVGLPSVQASVRDTGYIKSLERNMDTLDQSGADTEYNAVARDTNNRFNRSLSGRVASLLGITPAEIYEGWWVE